MRLVLRKTTTWLALVAALAAGYGLGNVQDGPLPLFGHLTNDTEDVVAPEPEPEAESPRSAEAVSEPEPEPADSTPPPLTVTSPADGAVFAEKTVRFEGETEPGALVSAGPYEAEVDDDGRWAVVLVLSPGDNPATFTASDAAGNSTSVTVTVSYDVPEPPVKKPAADEGDACATTTKTCDHHTDKDHDICATTTKTCDHHTDKDHDACATTTKTCDHHTDKDHDACATTTKTCDHHTDKDHDACATTTKTCDHDDGDAAEVKN